MNRRLAPALALALLAALAVPCVPHAETIIGPHLGFSGSPDQFILGGQIQFADVAPQLDFVPGVDLGLGDGLTVLGLNGDFHYRIPVRNTTWQPYAGAGVSLFIFSADTGDFGGSRSSGSAGGGSLILGADVPTQSGSRFFAEMKFGLGDGPSFRLIGGWHFRMR